MNWLRTSTTILSRGGALVTGYDNQQMRDAPLTEYGEVSEEQLWHNLRYFLERVLPVAESANVKLAMHPDDPPLSPIRRLGPHHAQRGKLPTLVGACAEQNERHCALPGPISP